MVEEDRRWRRIGVGVESAATSMNKAKKKRISECDGARV
ncbi:unnamed protein product [Arabidopsis lyrata]|nr:unnamed protein product [Arabidopsis lyrata]